jgi:outer membrane lipoprotein
MDVELRETKVLMRLKDSTFSIVVGMVMLTFMGCSSGPRVVPEEFQSQIDSSVSFHDIQAAPHSFQGRTVLLGGEILSAKRTQQGTEFEILQLPVTADEPPAERRSESQGRFLATDRRAVDPASLPPGTRVTMVGEVRGEELRRLDESTYDYPTLDVKNLYVWDPDVYRERSRSSVGLFGGVGFGFGGGGSGGFGGVGIGTGY